MSFTKSSYGYWIDPHGNIIPVSQQEEHSGVLRERLPDVPAEKSFALGWVRIALSRFAEKAYAEFERPLSPAQKEALYWICFEHDLTPWDERADRKIEAKRMSIAERVANLKKENGHVFLQ